MRQSTRSTIRNACMAVMAATVAVLGAAELDGEWTIDLSGSGGSYSLSLTLTFDGGKVTGTRGDETFTGTLEGDAFELAGDHYIAEAGYSAPLRLRGTLTDGRISGDATWDAYDATFVAHRNAEASAAEPR